MAIVEDRIILPIGLLDLVERLGDQEGLDPVSRHEGERAFEEIEAAQRRKFVEHQEQAPRPRAGIEILGEPPSDLVEDQADERLGAADVAGRHDEIERGRTVPRHQIGNPPFGPARHRRDDGVAIQAEKGHGGRKHPRAFIVRFVQQFLRGRGDDGMHALVPQMPGRLHAAQRRDDRSPRIGEKGCHARQRLVLLGIEDMEDRADEQGMTRLLPMVAFLEAAFGVDEDIGDILDIAHFPFAAAHFEQGVIG
jgi:hypothetical protein